jgi:hypothetical protein
MKLRPGCLLSLRYAGQEDDYLVLLTNSETNSGAGSANAALAGAGSGHLFSIAGSAEKISLLFDPDDASLADSLYSMWTAWIRAAHLGVAKDIWDVIGDVKNLLRISDEHFETTNERLREG